MTKRRNGLCVGGPWDRQRVLNDSDRFRVAISEENPFSIHDSEEITEPVAFNEVWYFERVFRFLEGEITLFTPEEISARDALLMLMTDYEKS